MHNTAAVSLLLDHGADINFFTPGDRVVSTPLIMATRHNEFEIVLQLLEMGADWTIVAHDYCFLAALRSRDGIDYKLKEQRDGLAKVHAWLDEHGIDNEEDCERVKGDTRH